MTKLEVGPAMDESVCKALGIAPQGFGYDEENDAVARVWPPVSTDRMAMWLAWDALVAKGYRIALMTPSANGVSKFDAALTNEGIAGYWRGRCDTEPEALSRAALAALGAS